MGREASRALGIGRSDRRALNTLEHGPLSHGELADAFGLTSGSVTTLVDRLVAANYVERHTDTADRRRAEVTLTTATYQAFATVYRRCRQAVAEALVDLDDRERHAAIMTLERSVSVTLSTASELRHAS